MKRYVAGRLVETVIVLVVMSYLIYGLIGLVPGDPIDIMVQADPNLTTADAARLKALYGLDKPLHERYVNWLTAALEGDFGYSRVHNAPVLDIIMPRLSNTLILMGLSFVVSLLIALPIGIYSALRPYGVRDYAVNFMALAGISIPGVLVRPHANLPVRRRVAPCCRPAACRPSVSTAWPTGRNTWCCRY